MPCYSPLQAWRGSFGASGKRSIVFQRRESQLPGELTLPCGQCVGCRLERSRQWAMRCVHESQMHKKNCFITLTFSNEKLPKDKSLDVRVFQLFMKRLRKHFGDLRIRYFHCGEYGEVCKTCGLSRMFCKQSGCGDFIPSLGRPHYHACLFGVDFDDRVLYSIRDGVRLYTSVDLDKLWGNGISTVGDVTFESAAYVARYIMKKMTGDVAEVHYEGRKPEYVTMSRRPGVGKLWFDKFASDVFPSDNVVLRGVEMRPPKFYDNIYSVENPSEFEKLKAERMRKARFINRWKSDGHGGMESEGSFRRLADKEYIKKDRIKILSRPMEDQ